MYLRYLSLVILGLIVQLLNVLLSPILPLFIRAGYLPRWLSWFAPADNPAWGDEDYHKREMAWASWMPNVMFLYVSAMCWMCRNTGYGYDNWAGVTVKEGFTLVEDEDCTATISRDDHGIVWGKEGTYHRKLINDGKEYFEYCKVWKSGAIWYRIQFGWNLSPVIIGRTLLLKFTVNRW